MSELSEQVDTSGHKWLCENNDVTDGHKNF